MVYLLFFPLKMCRAMCHFQMGEGDAASKMCHRYRPDAGSVLKDGIYHADILDKGGESRGLAAEGPAESFPERFNRPDEGNGPSEETRSKEETKKADERLFQRMRALFFWPAVMSAIK